MKWKTEKLPAVSRAVSPCLIKEAVLYPALFLPAPFVGIVQYFHDIGLFIECLPLYQIVRDYTECTVFLQCTPADFQQPGQFLVGDEPLSLECPASGGFQFIQCLAGLFQTPEEIRHTRIVLVDEIMAHNAAVLG